MNLDLKSEIKILKNFLSKFSLELDPLDTCFVAFDEFENIIACGGKEKNILKCFATSTEARATGVFDTIISSLLTEGYKQGFNTFFVYTKRTTALFFQNFNFEILAEGNTAALLYRGSLSIEKVLKNMQSNNCTLPNATKSIGAIVMNANPFTNGHRYLIDTALQEVDFLYVFVVQSNRSCFSFDERFMLVKENTSDLKNIAVLPSTDFLISNATFPSYFLKEEKLIDREHALIDAKIFLKYFVPYFKITKRFLGDEPLDPSTNIYNTVLTEILEQSNTTNTLNCKVKIISRLETSGKIINATVVRKALKENDLDSIASFVSNITFKFLQSKVEQ